VIATNLPEIRAIVEQTMCGILIEPGNIDEIVRAAVWLADHPEEALMMGRNGQMAISSTFNWQAIEDRLVKIYEDIEN
jgi:glycosyltransferase involved in cell wall biosynthesis